MVSMSLKIIAIKVCLSVSHRERENELLRDAFGERERLSASKLLLPDATTSTFFFLSVVHVGVWWITETRKDPACTLLTGG